MLQLQLHYFTLQYTRPDYTIPRYRAQHYSTLQYTTLITPHHDYNCNYNCATLITLHYNYNLQLQRHYTSTTTLHLQLRITTTALHHATSSSCGEVTTATIATTPKNTTPTTFWSMSGLALRSVIHNNQPPIGFLFLKLPPPPCALLLATLFNKKYPLIYKVVWDKIEDERFLKGN